MYNWQYIWLLLQVEERTRNRPELKHLHVAVVTQLESQSPVPELDPNEVFWKSYNEFMSGSYPIEPDRTVHKHDS